MDPDYTLEFGDISFTLIADPPSYINLKLNEKFIYIKNKRYHRESGIACILSYPTSLKLYQSLKERIRNEEKHNLINHKFVLLLHGMQSHKNATYQPLLSSKLSDMGYFVMRIDLRGCGDSEEVQDTERGRDLAIDLEDITTIYEFIKDSKHFLIHSLSFDTIVSHSRGVLVMFEFARITSQELCIPNLINCSGRFEGHTLYIKLIKQYPNWENENGYYCKMLRYGRIEKIWIPIKETMSFIRIDMSKCVSIDQRSWILSCYGTKEEVVPLTSASAFSNIFPNRHTLQLIEGANHNYYGLPDDPNISGLPLHRGKVNYCSILTEKILGHLSWDRELNRFFNLTKYIDNILPNNPAICSPRWPLPYEFSKISNFRDIGGYKTRFNNRKIKPKLIYRCANPSDATQQALDYLSSELKVKYIFDLRSHSEAEENGVIFAESIIVENLTFNHNMSISPEVMADHFRSLLISSHSFPKAYMIVLKNSILPIRKVFQYILDGNCNKNSAIVYHCTAGKDRTGILTMLLLLILGVDEDVVAKEYELTTIGLKTEEKLYKKIEARRSTYEEMFSGNASEIIKEYNITSEKMCRNLLSSHYESMRVFIEQFNKEFGSVEAFFINELQIKLSDIEKLRGILLE